MEAAAIILCAGKGTRMNDDTKNKVSFDCAGIPVIKRIVLNMKKAGVNRFVIVIGHNAYSVMDCLDGVDGIVYAYQKEQKGTGHAAMCGLKALQTVGYNGPVIISMGDKIISCNVINDLIERAESAKAVWGVQPLKSNFNGGRVITVNDSPYGVVELADAALMKLADVEKNEYAAVLKQIGLNSKKAEKVIKKAIDKKPDSCKILCGRSFNADEILNTKYANAGLYCLDLDSAVNAIENIGSNNAQGEVYLTDALEIFAQSGDAVIYEVKSAADMLTYSTKDELRDISRHFIRTASEFVNGIENGDFDSHFVMLYNKNADSRKQQYVSLLKRFISKYGDKKVVITRSPGRVNLMGRHIDHRGGGINVMTTDKDIVLVAGARDDDTVNITNSDSSFPDRSFVISKELGDNVYENWLDYLSDEKVVERLNSNKGDWSNYVKSAVIRTQFGNSFKLCGMDIAASGTIPVAAGLSSSSSIVVAVMEAVEALNCLNISNNEFINLCGEGEWFVGSRGGAGDHAAMKCGRADRIVHLGFKPFEVGKSAGFSDKYAVIVANSMIKAKKSEGSKDKFNAKVAAYEFAFILIKRMYPEYNFEQFRDIAKVRPYSEIYKILKSIPETVTRGSIRMMLPEYADTIKQIFSNHADPGLYELRGVSLYGISECARADVFMDLLKDGKYEHIGELMNISHNGDRLSNIEITDEVLDELIAENADITLQCGAYGCSTPEIDHLCDVLMQTVGVLGAEIVGAGLGGCVIALVEKEKADSIIAVINEKYYDKYGFERAANVYSASHGSCVLY